MTNKTTTYTYKTFALAVIDMIQCLEENSLDCGVNYAAAMEKANLLLKRESTKANTPKKVAENPKTVAMREELLPLLSYDEPKTADEITKKYTALAVSNAFKKLIESGVIEKLPKECLNEDGKKVKRTGYILRASIEEA